MLDAKMESAVTLKKLLDAIKELVTDANFECNDEGLKLQAMDNSHVALVSVELKKDAFIRYRCDHPMPLGVNLTSLTKVLKCAKDDDKVTLKAADDADILSLIYEAPNSDRIAEYDMKLMDIDSDTLGIPETDYDAIVKLSSSEFARIVRDLAQLGESVRIEVSKEGVRFVSEGESANGNVLIKQTDGKIEKVGGSSKSKVKKEEDADEEEEEEEDAPVKSKKSKAKKAKKTDDEDEEMEEDDGGSIKGASDDEEEEEDGDAPESEEEEGEGGKKRKRSSKGGSKAKKAKTSANGKSKGKGRKDDDDEEFSGAIIQMNQHVNLTFSLKYLINFAKSGSLSNKVVLKMSNEVPLLVQYDFGSGVIAYYLAPKIGDE